MQQYTVKYGDEIINDITELYGFYLDLVGERSAERFRVSALATINNLASFPNSHPMWCGNNDVRRINMPKHKVAIIYVVKDDVYEVIAVAAFHTLENPDKYTEKIKGRLKLSNRR